MRRRYDMAANGTKKRRWIYAAASIVVLVIGVLVYTAHVNRVARSHQFRIGHTGSPLLSSLYTAEKKTRMEQDVSAGEVQQLGGCRLCADCR